jgi:hypothetical protein
MVLIISLVALATVVVTVIGIGIVDRRRLDRLAAEREGETIC